MSCLAECSSGLRGASLASQVAMYERHGDPNVYTFVKVNYWVFIILFMFLLIVFGILCWELCYIFIFYKTILHCYLLLD